MAASIANSLPAHATAGDLLRQWRTYRRLSQLDLATNAEISTRHLSFLETGRTSPSREMILRLADQLQIPLRQRNVLLNAGGYASLYPERNLTDPALSSINQIVDLVLTGHEPNPALAIDQRWQVLSMNRVVQSLLRDVDPGQLKPPVNVIRLSLHPAGLAPRIRNLSEWRATALSRLRQRIEQTADGQLIELLREVQSYPSPGVSAKHSDNRLAREVVVPLQLATPLGDLNLITTTMAFSHPVDITVSEIAIECFFPQDQGSIQVLQKLASIS